MKILFLIAWAALPFCAMAQNDWEKPQQPATQQSTQKEKDGKNSKEKAEIEDKKYLQGAVPLKEGKVIFDFELDVPGKNAQEIYDLVYTTLDSLTRTENQLPESNVALVNRREHIIAARFKEWLVFQSTFLSLDRTLFNYTLIARCSDGHLNLSLSRISYAYETNRGSKNGLETTAENWITDEYALNKSKTKLNRMSGKFRRKTLDRKEELFDIIRRQVLK